MLPELSAAFGLLALCVAIHAAGLAVIAQWLVGSIPRTSVGLWDVSWLIIRTGWALAALHLVEIILWAGFYYWQDCTPDFKTATYFSGVSYSTLGYGDILLPRRWWFLGPMEALTGILMCGLSTGFFFVVLSKLFAAKQSVAAKTDG